MKILSSKRIAYLITVISGISLYAQQHHKKPWIVCWDFHDVIAAPDTAKRTTLRRGFKKGKMIKYALTDRRLLKTLIKTRKKTADKPCTEELLYRARKHHSLYQRIIAIDNARIPINGTIDIIKKLHNHNIEQHLGSNIGKTSFDALNKQEPFTSIFNYFDLAKSKIVTFNPGVPTILKPNPQFFHDYIHNLQMRFGMHVTPQDIIFIDNDVQNIRVAQSLGFHTILFTSPAALQRDLETSLGFTLS